MRDLDIIKSTVDDYFKKDISSKNRFRELVIARGVYFALALDLKNKKGNKKYSLNEIGKVVNRDHTTVINFKKKIKDDYEKNAVFNKAIKHIQPTVKYIMKYGELVEPNDKFKTHLSKQYEIVQRKNKILIEKLFKSGTFKQSIESVDDVVSIIPEDAIPEFLERTKLFIKSFKSRRTYENTTREQRG